MGLLSLVNIAIRFALTTPGPFNLIASEVPNLAVATFPYMFIPGFFAPLALVLTVGDQEPMTVHEFSARHATAFTTGTAHR